MVFDPPTPISLKPRMTLRRWLYEQGPQTESLLRQFDRECDEITSNPTPDSSVIEALEAASWPIATPADSQGCMRVVALADAIRIVQKHQAEQDDAVGTLKALLENEQALRRAVERQFTMPDGRPIFGEGSPHEIGEHLDRVCEQPLGSSERDIASSIREVLEPTLLDHGIQLAPQMWEAAAKVACGGSSEISMVEDDALDIAEMAYNAWCDETEEIAGERYCHEVPLRVAIDAYLKATKPVSLAEMMNLYDDAYQKIVVSEDEDKGCFQAEEAGVKAVLDAAGVAYE